ncbi:hypothetical protein Moror_3710, partial [Moniliophthora roreri MCA 2997]
ELTGGWRKLEEGGRVVEVQGIRIHLPPLQRLRYPSSPPKRPKHRHFIRTSLNQNQPLPPQAITPEPPGQVSRGFFNILNTDMTSPKISDVLLDSNTSTQRIPLTLSLSRLAGVYHPIFLLPLSTHSPSHPGPLAASVNKGNDEFVAAVVPEAIESLLDASFAALGTSCKADTARVDTSTMEGSCSNADTTIVFGDVENPRITILGSLGAGVIIEPTRKGPSSGYSTGGRRRRKEGERLWGRA